MPKLKFSKIVQARKQKTPVVPISQQIKQFRERKQKIKTLILQKVALLKKKEAEQLKKRGMTQEQLTQYIMSPEFRKKWFEIEQQYLKQQGLAGIDEEQPTAFQILFHFLRDNPKVLKYLSENEKARNMVFGHPEKIETAVFFLQRLGVTGEQIIEPYSVKEIPPYVWIGGGILLFLLLSRR